MKDLWSNIKSFFESLFKRDIYRHVRLFGVCEWEGVHYLVGAHKKTGLLTLIPKGNHGFSYGRRKQGLLMNKNKRPVNTEEEIDHAVFSKVGSTLFMLYSAKTGKQEKIHIAASKDGVHFKKRAVVLGENPTGIIELKTGGRKKELVLFYGRENIHTYASTNNGNSWEPHESSIFTPQAGGGAVMPIALGEYKHHIYLLYQMEDRLLDALVDNPNITHTIWEADEPLWKHRQHLHTVLGVTFENSHIALYVTDAHGRNVEEILLPHPMLRDIFHKTSKLDKHAGNPVISPETYHSWEMNGTFNPAAIIDDANAVHVLYRAIGEDGVSRLGYAGSSDGFMFDTREVYPAYAHGNDIHHMGPKRYEPRIYPSGGSWGGCEDPRLTRIGEKVYMTYTAFSGWNSIRIALTSISLDDFTNKRWDKWEKPILISPPGETHKNWVIFPEKIGGKYAILHGIAPRILIDYVDDLDHIPDYIESERLPGPQAGREGYWDNLLRGAGPPPIKTELGWLLFYHALDKREFHKYKVGAMILDLDDPTKIIYRSHRPVISPEMRYENEGKPGIVYASGALIKNNTLFIYYGGGDRVSCVATAPLAKFLETLKEGASFAGVIRTTKIES